MVLARVVRCASCGHLMKGSVQSATHRHLYRCSARFASGLCPRPLSISAAPLEAEVVNQLLAHLEAQARADASRQAQLAAAAREVEHATEALGLYLELTPTSRAGLEAHRAGVRRREERLGAAEDRLHRLLDAAELSGRDPDVLRSAWPGLSPQEKRDIFRETLDAVMVRAARSRSRFNPIAERILILFRGDAPPALRGVARVTQTWTWGEDRRLVAHTPEPVTLGRREPGRTHRRDTY
jgi:Recombinase zinc beta ribbon domain